MLLLTTSCQDDKIGASGTAGAGTGGSGGETGGATSGGSSGTGGSEGGTAGAGGSSTGGVGGETGKCPKYEPMDIHLQTPQTRDECTSKDQTCTTNTGPNLCRGIGQGTGFVEGKCSCNGTNWICIPHNLSKNNGCPLNPCESLEPQKNPQTKQGLLYCTPQDHESCQTDSWEICPDGSKGQTVTWVCSCQEDGSFTCIPNLKNDKVCPPL